MTGHWYEFGLYRLDPVARVVLQKGRRLDLTPKAVDTLRVLVQHAGMAVPKQQLFDEVWAGTIVEEGSLARNISDLRRVLGRNSATGARIETIPRRGYRFVGTVRECREERQAVRTMVAVLPFIARGANTGALAVAITDALITKLAGLRTCAVRAADRLGGPRRGTLDALQTARRLRVDFVVDGTVQNAGNFARVAARILSIETGAAVWGETFEDRRTGRLADSVAEALAGAVALCVSPATRKLASGRYANNKRAYQHYLSGRLQWNRRSERSVRRAIVHFRRAVEDDPEYALAYSGLAASYALLPMIAPLPPRRFMPQARTAAINALEIDESLPEARAVLAFVKWHYEWDWTGAQREFRRILKFHPNDVVAHQWYALMLAEFGQSDAAVVEARVAVRFAPDSASVRANAATVLLFGKAYDAALQEAERAMKLDGSSVRALWVMGRVLEQRGMLGEAAAAFRRASAIDPDYPAVIGALAHTYARAGRTGDCHRTLGRLERRQAVSSYAMAVALVGDGRYDAALEHLEQACDERDFHVVQLNVDERLHVLRRIPRFRSLVSRVGLGHRDSVASGATSSPP